MEPVRDTAATTAATGRKAWRLSTTLIAYAVLFVTWAATDLWIKGFATWSHTQAVLQNAAFLGIAAAGQTVVVMMAGIDLSVSGVMSLAAVVTSQLLGSTSMGPYLSMLTALAVSTVIGLLNGVGIYWLKLPPLVMTVAMLSMIHGAMLIYTNGTPPTGMSDVVRNLANSHWFLGFPDCVFIWLLVSIFTYWLLSRSRFGRWIYAIGTNERAAILSGVSVRNMTLAAYSISGLFAGIAGILLLGYLGNSYLTMGDPYQLATIAAVVLGGTSILGGRGNYLGTIAGTLMLGILLDVLTVVNMSQAGRDCALGALLILLLLAYGREKSQR